MRYKKTKSEIRVITLCVLTLIFCVLCFLAPKFMPNDPYFVDLSVAKAGPSIDYPFGTDALGRCVYSRILSSAWLSISSALSIVFVTLILGSSIGIISGYIGGKLDMLFMRFVDVFLAFPGMVLALAVAGMLGKGLNNAVIALILTGWPQYARLSRSSVLTMKKENFVYVAIINGQSTINILRKHIFPNVMRPIVVLASMNIGNAILNLAGLSFLGLGAQAPLSEWGSMLSEGRGLMQQAPWLVFYPSGAIFLASVIFNLLGDGVRDTLDPMNTVNIFNDKWRRKK